MFVADLIVGMEELELHYRCRGRSNLRKIKIATISVRMVSEEMPQSESAENVENVGHRNAKMQKMQLIGFIVTGFR